MGSRSISTSTSTSNAEYSAFEDKVKRTVYIDYLSPQVTEPVLRTAIDQFGTVKTVHFIPNYLQPNNLNLPRCALVEMGNPNQAKAVVSLISQFPLMISGMPKPVRALPAEVEMFDDRPIKPGRKIECHWLDQGDPDFEVANKIKAVTQKHVAQASFLLERQLGKEEKLAKQQGEVLEANYKKYDMIDGAKKQANELKDYYKKYNIRVSDD